MALIARWQIDARFGQKQAVVEMLRRWARDIAPGAGLDPAKSRLLGGSIGSLEATVEHEWEVADLTELERAWARLGENPEHARWGRELEAHVVSGTSKWTVLRIL